MPIYEFECKKCQGRFEAIRPVGDQGRGMTCPSCGAKAAKRVPSVFATSSGSDAPAACPQASSCGPSGFS
jgi:putative FmdB family regulatory protein